MEVKDIILKHALNNAIKFDGKANPGSVISALIAEKPEVKQNIKEISKVVQEIIKTVNSKTVEEQKSDLGKLAPEMLEKKETKKRELPELKNAIMGKVVTRIPPEPSKYLHVGHALSFLINYMYAKKYGGKCVLRFEDTNPEKSTQEFVDSDIEDLKYLGIKPDTIKFFSDDIPLLYSYAEKLIDNNNAYVCSCAQDIMQDNRHNGIPCVHRNNTVDENKKHWKEMLDGKIDEGKSILRLKIDMEAENQVMRDPVIFRIVKGTHFRAGNKYHVWPMYDFAGSVEEGLCNITHILRSSEFGAMRVELQDYIKKLFGFPIQEVRQYGRFCINGTVTQGRDVRELVESQKVKGWDDPRLATIKALRRRGFVKETFYELAVEVGLSPSPTNLDWGQVEAMNKRFIDETSDRYFFIYDPIKITISNAPEQDVKLDRYPEKRKGGRKFHAHNDFYLSLDDVSRFKDDELYRMMDCMNFMRSGNTYKYISRTYDEYKNKGKMIMHWLPIDETIDVEVLMNDGSVKVGLGEKNLTQLKVGDIIQFMRFGFCRLDKIEDGKLYFVFTHK